MNPGLEGSPAPKELQVLLGRRVTMVFRVPEVHAVNQDPREWQDLLGPKGRLAKRAIVVRGGNQGREALRDLPKFKP